MNRRILKKKSKKAAIILNQMNIKTYPAVKEDSYLELIVECKKSAHRGDYCDLCLHPLKGTPMSGQMEGYEYREWEERTAYDKLKSLLYAGKVPEKFLAKAFNICRTTQQKIDEYWEWNNAYWSGIARTEAEADKTFEFLLENHGQYLTSVIVKNNRLIGGPYRARWLSPIYEVCPKDINGDWCDRDEFLAGDYIGFREDIPTLKWKIKEVRELTND